MRMIALVLATLFSVAVHAVGLNKIVVFGDSLSDNGNLYEYMKHQLPLSPPYYKGRFTNGPVWVELLANTYYPKDAESHLLDYAFGGAGVLGEDGDFDDDTLITLSREIDSYLLAHLDKADENSLYIMWMGSNNYLAIPDDPDKTITDVSWGIKKSLERLADKGAKHIMVINIPDLGKTPAARDFDAVTTLSYCALTHNAILEKNIASLRVDYPSVQWITFDVNAMLGDMLDNPKDYGFINTVDTCYEEMIDPPTANKSILRMVSTIKPHANGDDACTGYLFFDPVHPAEIAHQVMAKQISALLENSDIEFR